ncbi:hypothetical protein SUGI_1034640 [Cryptomeria japonica]|uniref:uncharacterized protein LOC131051666 isoform X2 n=1 Tax=Cryptomeria japonica TaxID=3369 RepID=UPI00241489CE|nr:uncharacterized protein LOC131051666 isoform X2 [Cryptomeria japonica]GLJ49047.1 hypothetical protein SUGI_1034640 [Cryptomeria japonica]
MEPGISRAVLCFCISFLINFSHGNLDYEGVHRVPVKIQLPTGPLVESSPGVKPGTIIAGERVCIPGLKRFQNLKKYAHSRRVRVQYSEGLSKTHPKIELCLHRNATLGLVQCKQHEWKSLEKGLWTGVMSPYETTFIDIRMPDTLFGSLTFSVEEEFQQYRLIFLGFALLMLFLAPIVSKWVPFYYSSAMAFGVIVVILIIIFQGMKMLPTGRKSSLYLLLYGSVVGLGSVILRYISGLVHSVLQEFGFGEELFNPVAGLLLLCIVLAGAGLGHWGVRKLVLSEDGTVDRGTSLFVAFAIRILAATIIFESSCDSLLSLLMVIVGAFITFWTHILEYFLHMQPTFLHSKERDKSLRSKKHSSRWAKSSYLNNHQAQFLSRFPKEDADLLKSQTALKWGSYNPQIAGSSLVAPKNTPSPVSYASGSSLAASFKTPSPTSHMAGSSMVRRINTPSSYAEFDEQEYYSTFHETPARKHFSKKEWEDFTKFSTRKALRDLASSPEFTEWSLDNADRIMISPADSRKDRYYSDSDSEDSTEEERSSGGGWFW